MSEPLFWLVKGEERHAVHVRAIGRDVWPSVRRDHRVLWVSP